MAAGIDHKKVRFSLIAGVVFLGFGRFVPFADLRYVLDLQSIEPHYKHIIPWF